MRQPSPGVTNLEKAERPDPAKRHAPNRAPARSELPLACRRSNQKLRRRDSSADSRQLVARAQPERSSNPEYQKENELGAVRITTAFQPRRLMIAPAADGCKRWLDSLP